MKMNVIDYVTKLIPHKGGLVIMPGTASVLAVEPVNKRDFKLKEMYSHLNCRCIQIIECKNPDYIMVIDEEGKYNDNSTPNNLASALVDLYPDDYIAGRALVCKSSMVK
jgi:hypothetical protein